MAEAKIERAATGVLREMFARDRENAWQVATYQRSRRDELTSKIRFALAALNGASAVAVLTILGNLPIGELTREDAVVSLIGLVVGVALSGLSLYIHEGHLTYLAGQSFVRARSLDSCVSAVEAASDEAMFQARHAFMEKAHQAEKNMSAAENGYGVFAAHFAGGCWFASTLILVAKAAGLS